jgi:hypothetical protein
VARPTASLLALLCAACGEPAPPAAPVAPPPATTDARTPQDLTEALDRAREDLRKAVERRGEELARRFEKGPPPRPLRTEDVDAYVAIMGALVAAKDKAATLDAQLRERGIDRAWWDEMSGRVTTAAVAARMPVDAPLSETFLADTAAVAPHRERIRAVLLAR